MNTVSTADKNSTIPIDPRLFDDEDITKEVDKRQIASLEQHVFIPNESDTSSTDELEQFAINAHLSGLQSEMTPVEFIRLHSTINISKNNTFADKYRQDKAQSQSLIPRGNSRDSPTPFVYHCTKAEACTYETITVSAIVAHKHGCTTEKAESLAKTRSLEFAFACDQDNYDEKFRTKN